MADPVNSPDARLRLEFPPGLPISARASDIARALTQHPVVIIAGATGSGKTTQLPKIALHAGRGTEKRIGITQPRRIAATSVAARVASELGCVLGQEVGYQIRFEDRSSATTRLKFMTDGILLAEIQGDRLLRAYDTLILDEVHERSLNIDFLLGWLKRILPERPDLKLLVSSATLDTKRLSEFFNGAPVIEVEGRTFPVDVLYEPPDLELDVSEAVANAVENVTSLDPHGDILAFLPGEREIRDTERELDGRQLKHTTIQPLYGRLSASDQAKVFGSVPGRRVILATNVAETSLTLPGIVYVIDAGVARLARYDPRTGTTRLLIEPISRASADQRKGRSGRVREGICIRLYDEPSYMGRPEFTDPEIKRTSLAGVILRMKYLGLGDVEDFPFLDPPHSRWIREGYRVLGELGALDEEQALTPLGRRLARFPVDPRIGRMILAGLDLGCLPQVLVLSAALNIQDPRERPRGLEQKADQLHQRFRDTSSDFASLLKLWAFVREAAAQGTGKLRRLCKDNFLSFVRVREWMELERQLRDVVSELERGDRGRQRRGRRPEPDEAAPAPKAQGQHKDKTEAPPDMALHQALASGLLSRIGQYQPEQRNYMGARQTRFLIHPSSGLSKKPPAWLMAFELVETSQLFARTVAKIEPEWLLEVGSHLIERRFSDPFWSKKSARAKVHERATLFGMTLYRDRAVDYAPIEPGRARLMFLEHALVRGEYESRGAFQEQNRALIAEVARLRDKARQSDMLADNDALLAFFDRRVGDGVVSSQSFETWRQDAERRDPNLLVLSLEDVLARDEPLSPINYPDTLRLRGLDLALSYHFDPSAADDGVTLALPIALLPDLQPDELDWTIPGWHVERLALLLDQLPKSIQRGLGSVRELAAQLAPRLCPFEEPFLPALLRVLNDASGLNLTAASFRTDALPAHLRLNVAVIGEHGKVVAQSRDLPRLWEAHVPEARRLHRQAPEVNEWQRSGFVSWDFGELPPHVTRTVSGRDVRIYPALIDRGGAVDLTLVESHADAERATRKGVARLVSLAAKRLLSAFGKRVPLPFTPLDRRPGTPFSRTETDQFRDRMLERVVKEAYGLTEQAPLPRSRAEFDRLLAAGTPHLEPSFAKLAHAIEAARGELDETLRALGKATSQPSGTAAARDIRAQLELLFTPELILEVPLATLGHLPRYLRATRVRLARAISDPRKDADKLAPFAPLWNGFLEKARSSPDPASCRSLRWAFEELRVAIFAAPELKPAEPVTLANLALAVERLPGGRPRK